MKKRLLVVISCISLSVGGSLVTMANSNLNESSDVQARVQKCGNCGSMSLHTSVKYG